MSEERICENENCAKAFFPVYENQKYCVRACKRNRVMRRNRGRKNVGIYIARAADTKICEHCNRVIQRDPKTADYQWEQQKYHRKCYLDVHDLV